MPEGETVVFSAHGVAPSVHANAAARQLNTIDATCPLVTKVHVQARRYAADGYTVDPDRPRRPRGGRRHDGRGARLDRARRVGRGRRRGSTFRRTTRARVRHADDAVGRRDVRDHHRAAPSASRRSTRRRRKTSVTRPPTASGRSRRCSREIDLLLVIGSRNSSNSNRLVEVARAGGVAAHLIDDETEIDEAWLEGVEVVGVTARRLGAGEARRAGLRLVPRARRHRDRAVPARRRGRRVPAAGRAAPRARARRRTDAPRASLLEPQRRRRLELDRERLLRRSARRSARQLLVRASRAGCGR